MSKCDLAIVFDRADRRYQGGEEVTGTLHVQVNQSVQCDGLLLETFWQTHGRGNTDTGPKHSTTLFQGEWLAGTRHQYPFRFIAPDGPPTYRGHDLNIDQYVNVRVDVPWAIDPKLKEDYILLPAGRPYGNLPAPQREPSGGGFFAKFGIPVGIGLIAAGIVFACPFGPVLIPLGVIALVLSLRKVLAEKKIGKVQLAWGSVEVAPGGSVPLRMTFTPRKNCRLNGITAKLTATERCTSGSGTNRTTHTHRVHERTVPLVAECDLAALSPVNAEVNVPIPETGAYSFRASDNELVWELEVRIDIPLWPDWLEKRMLLVRPVVQAELAGGAALAPAAIPGDAAPDAGYQELRPETTFAVPDDIEPVDQEPLLPAVPGAREGDLGEAIEPPGPVGMPGPAAEAPEACASESVLLDVVDQLLAASRFGREREKIVEDYSDQVFECTIQVDRVDRVFGYVTDERFRNGRTILGVLPGTECQVSLQMAAEHNEKLDACHPGDTVRATGRLLKWNGIYDRLDMQEAAAG
jgi:hypothetical protein